MELRGRHNGAGTTLVPLSSKILVGTRGIREALTWEVPWAGALLTGMRTQGKYAKL